MEGGPVDRQSGEASMENAAQEDRRLKAGAAECRWTNGH